MTITPCVACYGKPSYSSWSAADRIRRRANRRNRRDRDDGSVYFCPTSGGYHVTSWARHDHDRLVTAHPHDPQAGDKPGDKPGDGCRRRTRIPASGENVGASKRNSTGDPLETLSVGPRIWDSVRKFGGPTPDRVDRLALADETQPRLELEVTLPVLASSDAHPQLDTPIADPPDLASYGDEIRPFDEYDADDERAS